MKQIFIKSKWAGVPLSAKIRTAFVIGVCMLLAIFSACTASAQSNITYAEYYLDQDPGLNLATPIAITASNNVQNVAVTLNVINISSGAHFFGTRARSADGVWSMNHYWILFKPYDVVLSPAPLTNITRVEYYVDNDPGIGKGTSVAITPSTNLADITFSVDPAPLVMGMHMIGSRAMTADGKWSKTNYWLFYKPYGNITPGAISNVSYVEYYVDNDPGVGNATSIAVAPALTLNDVNFNVNIGSTPSGTHIVGARAKDAAGKWSMTNYYLFVKAFQNIDSLTRPNITAVEYYLDYDPGKGNGIAVPVTAGTNLSDLTFNVDLTDIVGGTHYVAIRAKDSKGNWSFVNGYEFTKPGTPPTITTLVSTNTFCAGATLNVGYQLSAAVPFKSNNKFVAQLSDANGNFGDPREIGSINATNDAGSFSCTIPANATQSGSYRIRVITTNQAIIGANNGTNLTVYALPTVPKLSTPSADTTICQGNQLNLTSNANGYNAQWLLNDQPIANATSYNYSVSSFASANAGTYKLRLTNASVCSVFSQPVNVAINTNVPATPSISPSGNVGICLGGSKTLTSDAGTNQWYRNGVIIPGATANTYNVTSAGTYTVQASNGTCFIGSSNNAVVAVGVPPTTPTVTLSGPTTFCQGGYVTLSSSSFDGNRWFKNGVLISSATSQSYNAYDSGYYKVSAVNGSCEVFSDSVKVVVNQNVTAAVSLATANNNAPEGTMMTFTATPTNGGSSPRYTFRVNNNIVHDGPSNTYSSSTIPNSASVYVTITGNAPCSPNNVANSNTITVSYINPIVVKGRISHPLGMLIPSPKVRVSGGATDSTVANGDGTYSFTLLQQRNYTLAPVKNNDDIKAKGVNVMDVLQTQSHILGKTPLGSAYKIIAADVNSDNAVNIFDVLLTKRLILGIDTTFPGGKLWSFIDSTQTFANPANPFPYNSSKSYSNITSSQSNQSFVGVKLGDVNFDWTPTAGQNRTFRTAPVKLYYDTVIAEKGDMVRLKIRVKNFTELMGMQFTLGFNNSNFRFAGIENKQLQVEHSDKFADKGAITFIWADAANATSSLADGSAIFDVLLEKKQTVNNEDITILPSYTPAIAFGKDYEAFGIEKASGAILDKVTPQAVTISIDKIEVSPNPSAGLVKVTISSKEAKQIVLVVTDGLGRTVLQKPIVLNAGVNKFDLNVKEKSPVAQGIYYLKAQGLNVAPKQLLIINR